MASEKTILVVGAGSGQVPAILAAKRLGWRTVTVDRSSEAPGMKLADAAYAIDIVDFDGVLEVARTESIDGAITMQSDLPVPTVGYVNEQLGLPGTTLEVAQTCSNKHLARLRWQEGGVPQPSFAYGHDKQECRHLADDIGYPLVIKAPDASGSRGVVKVKSPVDFESAYAEAIKYSRAGGVLIEKFVPGHEIGAQTFSIGGQCKLVLLHNDQVSPPPYMIPTGHSYPFDPSGVDTERLNKAIARAVEALGIKDGPANVDLIVTPDGEPMMLEIGARIGATCLPELTTTFTGIDWVEAALLTAVGLKPDLTMKAPTPCCAAIIESPLDGQLVRFEVPEWVMKHSGIITIELSAEPGTAVSKLRKGTDRIGSVLVKGATLDEAEELCAQALAAIKVIVA